MSYYHGGSGRGGGGGGGWGGSRNRTNRRDQHGHSTYPRNNVGDESYYSSGNSAPYGHGRNEGHHHFQNRNRGNRDYNERESSSSVRNSFHSSSSDGGNKGATNFTSDSSNPANTTANTTSDTWKRLEKTPFGNSPPPAPSSSGHNHHSRERGRDRYAPYVKGGARKQQERSSRTAFTWKHSAIDIDARSMNSYQDKIPKKQKTATGNNPDISSASPAINWPKYPPPSQKNDITTKNQDHTSTNPFAASSPFPSTSYTGPEPERVMSGNDQSSSISTTPTSLRSQNLNRSNGNVKVEPVLEEELRPLSNLSKETWDNYRWEEQVMSQHPDLREGEGMSILKNMFPIDNLREDSHQWKERKEAVADHVCEVLEKEMREAVEEYSNNKNNSSNHDTFDGYDSYDSCASNDHMFEGGDDSDFLEKKMAYDPKYLRLFFDALRFNLIFNAGFDVLCWNVKDEESCYCPCSRKMFKWQFQFHTNGIPEGIDMCDTKKASKKMTPIGLMSHLQTIADGGGYLHKGISMYLKELYKDHLGGRGHKGLYKPGDDMYKEAEAEERRENIRAQIKLRHDLDVALEKQRVLEAKRKQEVEELNKLKTINSEMVEKIETLEKTKINLGIEAKEKIVLEDKTMKEYHLRYRSFFDILKMNLISPHDANAESREEKKRTSIKVKVGDNLQKLFNRFLDLGEKDETTFLFRGLDYQSKKGYHNWRLFLDWDVQFETSVKIKGRDTMKALDHGGPTAQFLSDIVWKQLGDLAVTIEVKNEVMNEKGNIVYPPLQVGDKVQHNDKEAVITKIRRSNKDAVYDIEYIIETKSVHIIDLTTSTPTIEENIQRKDLKVSEVKIKLFEGARTGIVPIIDDMIETKFILNKKFFKKKIEKDEIEEKAKVIYRAVGRIMLHCILDNKNSIPVTALPSLFRNILIRGIGPESDSYHKDDLIKHLSQFQDSILDMDKHYLGHTFHSILANGDERKVTKDNIFTELIPKMFVESRRISLQSMKEGLTLNGMVPIHTLFSAMPIEVVDKLVFSSPSISAEDVINILSPNICRLVEEGDSVKPVEEALVAAQVDFFENIIPDVLRRKGDSDSGYITRFVQFCTGSTYLPDRLGNPDFKIIVEFNFNEMGQDSLPCAHTCDHVFKIPGWAYSNDIDAFETRLDQCLELASKFSMM